MQAELERRSGLEGTRYSGVSIFSNRVKCGECGGWFGSKVWHSTDKYRKVIYRCNHKYNGKKCETPHITEEEIQSAFINALNQILTEREEIIDNIRSIQEHLCKTDSLESEQDKLREEMDVIAGLTQNCIYENARVAQNQDDYQKRYNGLVERYEEIKAKHDSVTAAIADKRARRETINSFIQTLEKQDGLITEFDAGLWSALADYVIVDKSGGLTVYFKDCSEVKL